MTADEFILWLRGFLEGASSKDAGAGRALDEPQIAAIEKKMKEIAEKQKPPTFFPRSAHEGFVLGGVQAAKAMGEIK